MKRTYVHFKFLVACAIATVSITPQALNAQTNVYDNVIAISPVHTTLKAALDQEGLNLVLQDNNANYTVFAPTNEAFDSLAARLGTNTAGLLALNNLNDILTYHVLGSEVDAASIMNGTAASPLSTTNSLKLTKTDGGDVYINQAQVTTADVAADNGLVHIVDAVLLPNETVVDAALDGGYSTLVTAVQQAELVPTLSDPFGTFTVFAPTNEAFNNLATALNTDLAGILALDNLADILTYHVLGEEVLAAGVTHGGIVQPVSQTNTLKTSVHANGDVFINQAQVTATDITVDNGIVHELDAAVLPNETVVDVALDNGFSTLATAVITAELLSTLSDPFAEYTVFAPTNEAFDNIVADLGTDINGLLALESLSDILLYHVTSGTTLSTALSDGMTISALSMQDLTVSIGDDVMINRATVTQADVEADNGVVHVIDRVILFEPLSVSEITTGAFKFFPNPSTDMIQVFGIDNAEYEIYSMDGSMVKAGNVNGAVINVNDLQSGTYLINVRNEESMLQSKMVKM